MIDYAALIDNEIWNFVLATQSLSASSPVEPVPSARDKDAGLAAERDAYAAMAQAFHAGRPAKIIAHDTVIAGVPARDYGPGAGATVVYFHGGGFVMGGLESHDDICAEICAATGLHVIAADYRLAPEHPHPAALADCLALVRALLNDGNQRILLVGDSAGGNLAAAVAQRLGGATELAGVVLIYPGLGGDPDRGSYLHHADAPLLSRADVITYASMRVGEGCDPYDPSAAPLRANDFSGHPPTLAFAAECDPLCDDAGAYAARVAAAGGRARAVVEPGLVHGYLRARHSADRAAASFKRITAAIAALGQGRWPE